MTATAAPVARPDWPFRSPDSDELAALVAGLRANPANELARLIVADWHEENGDEDRAEYIRLASRDTQSLLWGTGSPAVAQFVGADEPDGWQVPSCATVRTMTPIRQTTLLPALEGVTYTGLQGFIVGWRGPVYQWLEHGRTVMRREPVVEVRLEGVEPRSVFRRGELYLSAWDRMPDDFAEPRANELPDVLFDLLSPTRVELSLTGRPLVARYATHQAATDDLRRAAVRFALGSGGLTPHPHATATRAAAVRSAPA